MEIEIPHGGDTLTTAVAEERFFQVFDQSRIEAITATARDGQGKILAHGVNASPADSDMVTGTTETLLDSTPPPGSVRKTAPSGR